MAAPFEVNHSTASPETVRMLLESDYDLPRPLTCKLIRRGFNDPYTVTAGQERYLFRLYLREKYWVQGESDLRWELDLLSFLQREGIGVSSPLPRRCGDMLGAVQAPEGIRRYALFAWAPGEPPHEYTETYSRLVGETVARLHRAGDQFETTHSRFELGFGYLLEEPLRRLQPYLTAEDYGYLESVAGRIRDRLGSLSLPADGWGIIHGDLHKGNSHLTTDGRLTLFDFDIAGYGWRAYDVATFCMGASENCRAAFLDGYQSVRPLSEAEHQAIPALALARIIWDDGDIAAMTDVWGEAVVQRGARSLARRVREYEEKFPL